jgi:hypothetical protein
MSETGDYLFRAYESGQDHGTWYVGMEPRSPGITIFNKNVLAIELNNPTEENANAVASFLNKHVSQLRVSPLP